MKPLLILILPILLLFSCKQEDPVNEPAPVYNYKISYRLTTNATKCKILYAYYSDGSWRSAADTVYDGNFDFEYNVPSDVIRQHKNYGISADDMISNTATINLSMHLNDFLHDTASGKGYAEIKP